MVSALTHMIPVRTHYVTSRERCFVKLKGGFESSVRNRQGEERRAPQHAAALRERVQVRESYGIVHGSRDRRRQRVAQAERQRSLRYLLTGCIVIDWLVVVRWLGVVGSLDLLTLSE